MAPNGTLLVVFLRVDFELELGQLYAARSLDDGRTWLPPVLAGSRPFPPPLIDPETGIPLPQPGFPSATVAPDGSIYVAFEASTSSSSGQSALPGRGTQVAPGPAPTCRG
jgi:hypothetical protein